MTTCFGTSYLVLLNKQWYVELIYKHDLLMNVYKFVQVPLETLKQQAQSLFRLCELQHTAQHSQKHPQQQHPKKFPSISFK